MLIKVNVRKMMKRKQKEKNRENINKTDLTVDSKKKKLYLRLHPNLQNR